MELVEEIALIQQTANPLNDTLWFGHVDQPDYNSFIISDLPLSAQGEWKLVLFLSWT
jgi:hypothetical protein